MAETCRLLAVAWKSQAVGSRADKDPLTTDHHASKVEGLAGKYWRPASSLNIGWPMPQCGSACCDHRRWRLGYGRGWVCLQNFKAEYSVGAMVSLSQRRLSISTSPHQQGYAA